MTLASLLAISPLLVLGSGAVLIMLVISVTRRRELAYWLTLLSLVLGAAASIPAMESETVQLTPLPWHLASQSGASQTYPQVPLLHVHEEVPHPGSQLTPSQSA